MSDQHPPDPDYWTAYLASHIAHAIPEAGHAKNTLRKALRAFIGSPCCSVALAEDIRKSTKGEARV